MLRHSPPSPNPQYVHSEEAHVKLDAGAKDNKKIERGNYYFRDEKGNFYRSLEGYTPDLKKDEKLGLVDGKCEITTLDFGCRVLDSLYAELCSQLKPTDSVKAKLTKVIRFVRTQLDTKHASQSKTDAFCAEYHWGQTFHRGVDQRRELIPITSFIKKKLGMCRHNAILVYYFLIRLVQDGILPPGNVHLDRPNFTLSNSRRIGHAWVIYQPFSCDHLYHLDSMWHENAFDLQNSHDRTTVDKDYGSDVVKESERRYAIFDQPLLKQDANQKRMFFRSLFVMDGKSRNDVLTKQIQLCGNANEISRMLNSLSAEEFNNLFHEASEYRAVDHMIYRANRRLTASTRAAAAKAMPVAPVSVVPLAKVASTPAVATVPAAPAVVVVPPAAAPPAKVESAPAVVPAPAIVVVPPAVPPAKVEPTPAAASIPGSAPIPASPVEPAVARSVPVNAVSVPAPVKVENTPTIPVEDQKTHSLHIIPATLTVCALGSFYALLDAPNRKTFERWMALSLAGVLVSTSRTGISLANNVVAFFQRREDDYADVSSAHEHRLSL